MNLFRRIINTTIAALVLCTLPFMQLGVYVYFLFGKTSERKRMALHRFINRRCSWAARNMPATTFTVDNPSGEDFSEPALIICNHQSHFDLVYLLSLTPKMVVLTNDWVWNCPFYNILIHRAEFYPVSDGFVANLPRLQSLVARGYSVLVFPEGTRSETCRILRFHQGAFKLARDLNVPVLPITLYGTGRLLRKHSHMLAPADIVVEIGRIFAAQKDALAQAKAVRAEYKQNYERIRSRYE